MHVRFVYRLIPAIAAVLPLALPSQADDAGGEPLEPIVVTATRTAQTVDETLAAVTIITREDIERSQAQTVNEVLQGTPGLTIDNQGGLGKLSAVHLRGTDSDHVLILVDGVKIGSALNGLSPIQDIPLELVERIEIVRGPHSSLYGSEAIGGVIQIFTRKGGGGFQPFVSVGAGSHATYSTSAGINAGGDQGWFNLSADAIQSEGFDSCENGAGGCYNVEPDDDGYERASGSLRVGRLYDNGASVDLHALYSAGRTEYDGSYTNEAEFTQRVLGATVGLLPTQAWAMTLAASQYKEDTDNLLNSLYVNQFNTVRNNASWQNDLTLGHKHTLTLGADYQEDRVDTTTTYAQDQRDNTGVFAQYQGDLGAHDLLFGLRNDDNSQFGDFATGNVAWGYAYAQRWRFTASYGTAFKAPNFNELYYPGYSNPDLQPEESASTELGLTQRLGWGQWSLNAYQTDIDNLIVSPPPTYLPVNLAKAQIQGVEAVVSARVGYWRVDANLALSNPENRSPGADYGNLLPRRAEQSAGLQVDYARRRWSAGFAVHGEGERYEDTANTLELAPYAVADLRAELALDDNWSLQGRVGNLFDADYQTAAYYNQDGRNVFFTLRYRPGAR